MIKLVLLRHGQSAWNLENKFTGWKDVDLTKKGEEEAKEAGELLSKENYKFDAVHTSLLKRANRTMQICLEKMGQGNIPIYYSWRLNERHYGSLQGLNKAETAKKYGDEQVHIWRRSYTTPPPKLAFDDERHPRFDKKYSDFLKDTVDRFLPYWNNSIRPDLEKGKKILIVAHGNSLRALVKYIDKINDKDILDLNIPTGAPFVYELESNLNPIKSYYLGDEEEMRKRAKEVAAQSSTK